MFPRLLHFGGFNLPSYGVLSAVGIIVALFIAVKLCERSGIDGGAAWDLGIVAVVASILGSKLMLLATDWTDWAKEFPVIFSRDTFSALIHWDKSSEHLRSLLIFVQAGGVWYGGMLLGCAVSWWWMRRHKMPVLRTFDCFAPGIILGHAIGRVGCFAAGCCYGKPTTKPWGVTFTNPLANFYSGTPLGMPLHPTQLYEAVVNTGIFVALLWLWKHKRFDGQVLGAYFFLYGVARYFLEFFRDDPERGSVFGGAMSLTQLIAICLVILGGVLWLRRSGSRPRLASVAG